MDPQLITALLSLADWTFNQIEKSKGGGMEIPADIIEARTQVRKALTEKAVSRSTRKKTTKKVQRSAASDEE